MILVKRYIIGVVVITMIHASYMTIMIIKESILENNIRQFMKDEFSFKGTQIISHNYNSDTKTINIISVGKNIVDDSITIANNKLGKYNLDGYKLNVIQGTQSDSFLLKERYNGIYTSKDNVNKQIINQANEINALKNELQKYTKYETTTGDIHKELNVIYPGIKSLIICAVPVEANSDTIIRPKYTLAVINNNSKFSTKQRKDIEKWLKIRIKTDSLKLILEN